MAEFATEWDIWYAGLTNGPEPPGRRTAKEIAAMRAEADHNFALACDGANKRWKEMYGDEDERRAKRPAYDSVYAFYERLAR